MYDPDSVQNINGIDLEKLKILFQQLIPRFKKYCNLLLSVDGEEETV